MPTSGRLLGGFVDKIVQCEHGAELIDYKTGEITDQATGDVRASYEVQLLLYAGLYHDSQGEWPCKLTLTTLYGIERDVPLDRTRSLKLMNEARDKLRELNELITEGFPPERFATPSPSACTFCSYRPACKQYWRVRGEEPDWPADLSGILTDVKTLGQGTLRVVIDTGRRNARVRGLSPKRFTFINEGVKGILLCNLKPDVTKDSYIQTPLTAGYPLER